jgi:TIR domain
MNETGGADETSRAAPVRVFISYAWEDDEYRLLVKRLATRVRADGVNARLDVWHLEGLTIPEFMSREVRLADKFLAVCSPQYRQKAHAMEEGEGSRGSPWELMLATSRIWTDVDQRNIPSATSRSSGR